jgi:hypothetical protein
MFRIRQASEQTAGTITRSFTVAGNALRSLAAGLGVGFSIGGLIQATKAAIDFGDRLGDAAARTGVAIEKLQALQFQAQQSGSSAETMASGLAILAKNIGQDS